MQGRSQACQPQGRATLTLEAASSVATCVHPGCAVVANAPHHAPAAGLHHPQVAAHLPPEPGRRGERAEKRPSKAFQPPCWSPGAWDKSVGREQGCPISWMSHASL